MNDEIPEDECTCYHKGSPLQNVQDSNGCPIHCQHWGINRSDEWQCGCGASSEDSKHEEASDG